MSIYLLFISHVFFTQIYRKWNRNWIVWLQDLNGAIYISNTFTKMIINYINFYKL